MTIPNLPPDNTPGGVGSPIPYVQPPNAEPVVVAKPQGLKRIAHVFAGIAAALFVAYFVYAAHYDAAGGATDGTRGALIFAAFIAAGVAAGFYVFHATRR